MKEQYLFGIIGLGNPANHRNPSCPKTKKKTKTKTQNQKSQPHSLAENLALRLRQLWALTAMYDGALLGIVALLALSFYITTWAT